MPELESMLISISTTQRIPTSKVAQGKLKMFKKYLLSTVVLLPLILSACSGQHYPDGLPLTQTNIQLNGISQSVSANGSQYPQGISEGNDSRRTATYVIAASNATATEKAEADYICTSSTQLLTSNANGGDSLIHVADSSGFIPNEVVTLTDNGFHNEYKTVLRVSTGIVNFTSNLIGSYTIAAGSIIYGGSDDVQFNAAFTALPSGGTVKLTSGEYVLSATVIINKTCTFIGTRGDEHDGTNNTSVIRLAGNTDVDMFQIGIRNSSAPMSIDMEDFYLWNETTHGGSICNIKTYNHLRESLFSNIFMQGSTLANFNVSYDAGGYIQAEDLRFNHVACEYSTKYGFNIDSFAYNVHLQDCYSGFCTDEAFYVQAGGYGLWLEHCWVLPASLKDGIAIFNTKGVTISDCQITDWGRNGIYIYQCQEYDVHDCVIGNDGTTGTESHIVAINLLNNAGAGKVHDNQINIGTTKISSIGNAANTEITNNQGYIAPGEIRTISGVITGTASDNGAIMLSIDNPFGQAVRVTDVQIEITANASAAATMNCGIGSSATTSYTTMLSVLPINPGTSYPYFYSATATATYGQMQTVAGINWATGSGNRYLNFFNPSANASGTLFRATYAITIMGN